MNKIIFLDTVTTGMNHEKCAIYRIGGIVAENGVEQTRFEFHVRPFPNARISDSSLYICNESRASLVNYPDQAEAFNAFIGMLSKHVNIRNPFEKLYIGGFNVAAFDIPFLREWFRRNGNNRFRDYFHAQPIDIMSIAAFALLNERRGMPDFHLETVAKHFDIRMMSEDLYNCVSNAKICLDLFRKLQYRFGLAEVEDVSPAEETIKNF